LKRNRIIYAVLWILSLVGISFFGGTVSYGIFATLTIVPVISALYLVLVYFLFHIYQRIDSLTLTVNQPAAYYFTLSNEFFLTFVGVRVRFYSDYSTANGMEESEYELVPKTELKRELFLTCKYRGEYEVGIRRVEITDYFQLLRFSYRLSETMRVKVRPQLVLLDALKQIEVSKQMQEIKKSSGRPDVLARPYVIGDDIRRVHWGLSAKSGELMVRETIGEEKQGIGIVLSTTRRSEKPKDYLPQENKQLELVLAIAYFLAKIGIPTKEYHAAEELSEYVVPNLAAFDSFYETISEVGFAKEHTIEKLVTQLKERSALFECQAVFFVLDRWEDAARLLVAELTKHGVFTVVYLVGVEKVDATQMPDNAFCQLICIASEADLREVM